MDSLSRKQGMVWGGLRLAFLVLAGGLRRLLGREAQEEEVAIQVPPVPERRRKRAGRRRLGSKAGPAPPAQSEEAAEAEDQWVPDLLQEMLTQVVGAAETADLIAQVQLKLPMD